MKTPFVPRVVAAGCVGVLVVSTLYAQRASAPPPQTGTALVDVSTVAQKSTRFKAQLEALKGEYDASAATFKKESDAGNELTERLRKLPPDSPERKKMEADVMKMRADFELRGKRITEDMRDRETKLIYAMSRELQAELARFAQANGIQLVFRTENAPGELNDPRAIIQEIQKPIVYQRDADITPAILEAINRRGAGANTATRPTTQPKGAAR